MTQDLLHDGQWHAGPNHFHGPGMAQDMRMNVVVYLKDF
jgi:hypothetical protein